MAQKIIKDSLLREAVGGGGVGGGGSSSSGLKRRTKHGDVLENSTVDGIVKLDDSLSRDQIQPREQLVALAKGTVLKVVDLSN